MKGTLWELSSYSFPAEKSSDSPTCYAHKIKLPTIVGCMIWEVLVIGALGRFIIWGAVLGF